MNIFNKIINRKNHTNTLSLIKFKLVLRRLCAEIHFVDLLISTHFLHKKTKKNYRQTKRSEVLH